MYLVNSNQKKATVAILIPGKVDFRVRKFNRDKEGHFILIKWSIHQEDITLLNVYEPNSKASKYMKQKLTELNKKNRENLQLWVGISIILSAFNGKSIQINKDIKLNNTIDKLDLITFLGPTYQQPNTHFSSAHRTFTSIDHILGHKTNVNKF